MQNLSNGKRRDEAEFQEKRRQSRRMIRMVIELVKVMSDVGCKPAWEWPLRACSWQLPEMDKLYKLLPYSARVDGCCYGMRTIDTGTCPEVLAYYMLHAGTVASNCVQMPGQSHSHTDRRFQSYKCNVILPRGHGEALDERSDAATRHD